MTTLSFIPPSTLLAMSLPTKSLLFAGLLLAGHTYGATSYDCKYKNNDPYQTAGNCMLACMVAVHRQTGCDGKAWIPSSGIIQTEGDVGVSMYYIKKDASGIALPAMNLLATCQQICNKCTPPSNWMYDDYLHGWTWFYDSGGEKRDLAARTGDLERSVNQASLPPVCQRTHHHADNIRLESDGAGT